MGNCRGLTKSSFVVAFAGINLGPSFMIKKIITPQRAKEGTCGSSSGCYDAYMLSRRKVLNNTRLLEMGFAGGVYRMFGLLMLPLLTQKQHSRIFEIGLGPCNLSPGASILVWQSLLPNAKLWVADYNANCVERLQTGDGMIYGARALIGDQSNRTDLRRWVHETGGRFDAIIDDGGHSNKQILTSFEELWPTVVPGGLYLIEDLGVGWLPAYDDNGGLSVSFVMQAWSGELIMQGMIKSMAKSTGESKQHNLSGVQPSQRKYLIQHHWGMKGDVVPKMPSDLDYIFCEENGCALGKRKS